MTRTDAKHCGIALCLLVLGCAKQKADLGCPQPAWSGQCSLVSVTKIEDREHPVPHVVLEAKYRPMPNASAPNYAPPEVSKSFWVKSEYEGDLVQHLEQNRLVACGLPAVPAGTCSEDRVAVNVPAFDMARAEQLQQAPKVVGCARIETASEQDRLALGQSSKTKIPETMLFEADSAILSPEARAQIAAIAERLKALPNVECIGVVGQTTTGEPPTLGAERARNVRDLLVSLGVPIERTMTIIATTSVFGAGAKPADPDPKQRKVGISVLLEQTEVGALPR